MKLYQILWGNSVRLLANGGTSYTICLKIKIRLPLAFFRQFCQKIINKPDTGTSGIFAPVIIG